MLNTTDINAIKYLHWFDWKNKELHLFDIINNVKINKS